MYRCEVCRALSRPGQARLSHAFIRLVPRVGANGQTREEIAREISVCPACKRELAQGRSPVQARALAQQRSVQGPIEEILDGDIYQLSKGEDFSCTTEELKDRLSQAASAKGAILKFKKLSDTEVVVQATKQKGVSDAEG